MSDLSAITGLTRIERLDLSQTAVGMADLKKLVGIKKLVSGPGPDTNPQEFRGLRFGGCAATREDARVAEISRIEDPSERARVLFEYLETWVPPIPPELPEQTHRGLRYRVGPSGLVDYDPASSPGLATAQQRQLHAFLVEDAGQVAGLFGSGHNQPFAYVSQKLGRYGAGLGAALEEISPAIVWKVGNDLRLALAADGGRRPGDMTNRPAFDVDQRAGLEGLVSTHNALVSLHPDLAALDAVAVDPAQRHVVERDRALMEAAIEAFAAQTRLILVEVVRDLRDLHDEALGETRAAIRAMRIEE
ncbi:hypothetical protein, partial [Tabrizicola sp.]|uniref:hypothetical protein n=1 Tax=Tabrizicola sp. TaxID=2005166 RepID=UPI00286B71B9